MTDTEIPADLKPFAIELRRFGIEPADLKPLAIELRRFGIELRRVKNPLDSLFDTEPIKLSPDRPLFWFERHNEPLKYGWDYHRAYETQIGMD
jgi:hypothetical protein